MKQMTLAATRGFEKHNRATRKAEFLARMDHLMPWAEFCAVIEPHYPKAGNGRPPASDRYPLVSTSRRPGARWRA